MTILVAALVSTFAAGPFGATPAAAPATGKPLVLKLGTLVAEGSPWHTMLVKMNQEFVRISGGAVKFNIFPAGVLGDEPDLVKKLRIGQIQAAGLSAVGLSLIDDGVFALHLPLMFSSDDELDWVRERISAKLEADLSKKGFVLLTWTDGGWVRFFSKKPFRTMDELRRIKLFVWSGDQKSLELYTIAKFRPVPLAATDMLISLQTGLIDAVDTPPLAALINQWFGIANQMLDLKWAPLMGSVVVSKAAWGKVPPDQQVRMMAAAKAAARQMRSEIWKLDADAIPAMVKRGLTVTTLDAATRAEWQREVEAFWPAMRGKMGPAAYYDEVMRLRAEYRAKRPGAK
ncbi:MAG: TRAP transporter substrate-binding protein DctP [Candidatus Coatesbacteria bacterium]